MTQTSRSLFVQVAGFILPMLFVCTTVRTAEAQTFPVSIVAFTGSAGAAGPRKCLSLPATGGISLEACTASPSQTFNLTQAGQMKLSTSNDCVGVMGTAASVKAGAAVSRMSCATTGALLNWRSQGGQQMILVGSSNNSLCMNGDLNGGALTVGDCSKVTTKFTNFTRYLAFHVHDSTGKDTGNCLSDAFDSGSLWSVQPCNANAAGQHFMFDSSGTGGLIAVGNLQGNSLSWDCPAAPASWNVGGPVTRQKSCSISGNPPSKPPVTPWRWTSGKLVGIQSPNQGRCLTLDANRGPGLFVGDCTKPASLTQWDVTLTSF